MERDFALIIDPDGQADALSINEGDITGQHRMLHTCLGKGYATLGLGRFLVHESRTVFDQQANVPAQQLWTGLSGGGSPAPFLRGPVIVTARRRPDGSYPALLPGQLDRLCGRVGQVDWAPPTRPAITAAQAKGTRKEQCDALAVHTDPATGMWAYVVCDGVGDHVETRAMAHAFAQRIAIVAAETGDPGAAVHTARAELPTWQDHFCSETLPTSTVAAAVWRPGAEEVRIAWAGDSRIYVMGDSGFVDRLTEDHNVAGYNRARGAEVREGDEHLLLSSIESGTIQELRVHRERVRELLLCTDGVYGPLEAAHGGGVSAALALMSSKEAAGALVADSVALANRRSWDAWGVCEADNATALIVDFLGL
ncbi:PP2C family protein-serine/threonine phosphatase [Kitasatospora sp. NPDC059795]|uniref:PP2C family protein-serine/threonine phosphatase n=1 Tax=Kitasatospora sp. NPDC059795 TaxID=3346949 RepID=UPI003660469F